MGKPKKSTTKSGSGPPIIKSTHHNPTESSSLPKNASVQQLLQQAEQFENQFETAKSLKLYNRVLAELEPCHPTSPSNEGSEDRRCYLKALQSSVFNLLELGKPERAKERLLQLLQLTRDVEYEVFMYMGQLTEAQESLNYYREGLERLNGITGNENALSDALSTSNKSLQTFQRAESNAYCAIAELYMTDLCDLPEAEAECRKAFDGSCQTDPTNPQAWMTAANFYTITGNTESACESVQRCLDLWWSKLELFLKEAEQEAATATGDVSSERNSPTASSSGLDNKPQSESKLDLEEITGIPSTGLISLSRILIELEMWEQCATILEALLEEEEDNLEVYYLLTVVGQKLWLEDDPELLRLYATTAKVIAGKTGDAEMVQEMTDLLDQLPACPETDDDDQLENYSTTDDEAENDTNEKEAMTE